MVYITYLKYILQNIPTLFLLNYKFNYFSLIFLIPASSIYYINFFFKYSFFFKHIILLDLGGYEVIFLTKKFFYIPIIWYYYKNNLGNQFFLFSFYYKNCFSSIEILFRNARWLEREVSEFFGIFFLNKQDRRILFTIPLFYNEPLRKKYPSIGFYELFFCPILKKLRFKNISLQV